VPIISGNNCVHMTSGTCYYACQTVLLTRLYKDARSAKHKNLINEFRLFWVQFRNFVCIYYANVNYVFRLLHCQRFINVIIIIIIAYQYNDYNTDTCHRNIFTLKPQLLGCGLILWKTEQLTRQRILEKFVVREIPAPVSSHQSLITESLTQKVRNNTSKNELT
jgi:hypothetical protein